MTRPLTILLAMVTFLLAAGCVRERLVGLDETQAPPVAAVPPAPEVTAPPAPPPAPAVRCGWIRGLHTSGKKQVPTSLAVDALGNVLLAGIARANGVLTNSHVIFAGSTPELLATRTDLDELGEIFVVKLDPAGVELWRRELGEGQDPAQTRVGTDAAGNVLLAGVFHHSIDLAGRAVDAPGGGYDSFVAKLGPDGRELWGRRLAIEDNDELEGMAVDGAGNLAVWGVTGRTGPTLKLFVARLDGAGVELWRRVFSLDAFYVMANAMNNLAVDSAGNVALAFTLGSGVTAMGADLGGGPLTIPLGSSNSVVAKFDASGRLVFSRLLNGVPNWSAEAEVPRVAFDGEGQLYVTGRFSGSWDFGAQLLSSKGPRSFLATYDPAGRSLWAKDVGRTHTAIAGGAGHVALLAGTLEASTELWDGVSLDVPGGSAAAFGLSLDGQTATAVFETGLGGHATEAALAPGGDAVLAGAAEGDLEFCGTTLEVPKGANGQPLLSTFIARRFR